MSIQDGSCLEGYSVGYCSLCNKGANNKLYSVQGKWFCPYCYPVAVNIKIANEKINPTTKTYPAAKVRALVEAAKCALKSLGYEEKDALSSALAALEEP